MLSPSRPTNSMVATSINKQYSQQGRAGRRHLAFAVANCVLNRRFAAATIGSCGGLPERPEIWGKMLFLFNCHFFCSTSTNRDLSLSDIKLFIFQHGHQGYEHCRYWGLAVLSKQRMARNDTTWHSNLAFSRHGFHKYENCNFLNHSGLV